MKTIVYLTKKAGKLDVLSQHTYNDFVEDLEEGEDIKATLVKVENLRTIRQNSLYWRILTLIADTYGDLDLTTEKWHKYFKNKWLSNIEKILGEDILESQSTTDLTKQEFTDYIEKIALWAAEKMNIQVLNEDDRLFLKG